MEAEILVVDDTPANIDLMVGILEQDYRVRAAVNGERALKAVEANPPDLILLDVMMPGMDGYEVCRRLKSNPSSRDIPVIFVTAKGEIEDEAKGFELGAVDYVAKPVSTPIVRARVRTQLSLLRARQHLSSLLNETLLGATNVLSDLLALSNVEASGRAVRLRRYVRHMIRELELRDGWRFEMAASLSQIACINLPPRALHNLYQKNPVTQREITEEMMSRYFKHPETAASLLEDIPRLKVVAAIIGAQMEERLVMLDEDQHLNEQEPALVGAWLLKTAIRYDELALNGAFHEGIIESLREPVERFPGQLIDAIASLPKPNPKQTTVKVSELREGMLLLDDIYTSDGIQIMPAGFEINPAVLEHLQAFQEEGFREPVKVVLPNDQPD